MRLLAGLVLISIVVGVGVYFITGERRWLKFSWQIFKFSLALGLIASAIFMVGRLIV
jgi:hypothetical protein